jgi:hypothetical protein
MQFVHVFQKGKMNKDLDERLVPNGEYRDALNLDLADSQNGNMGSLQNVKGTIELRSKAGLSAVWTDNYIDGLTNPECIGTFRDDLNEKIYWFITSSGNAKGAISIIAEYDQTSNTVSPILVDKQGILKFSRSYLITGINILGGMLFWTDNQTEPKKINIEKFKTGSTDFDTHTKIPTYIPNTPDNQPQYEVNLTGTPDFTEADITVIKKSPLASPSIVTSPSKFGPNVPGTGIAPVTTSMTLASMVNFTYVNDATNLPDTRVSLDTYGEWLANTESDPDFYDDTSIPNWNGTVSFNISTAPPAGTWGAGSIMRLETDYTTEFYVNYHYEITIKIDSVVGNVVTGKIQAISENIETFLDSDLDIIVLTWEGLIVEEAPMFEYVFPRFAYRWKYIDNEYSTFSPFSEVAFEGGKFEYVSSDGYNIGMTNNIRQLTVGNISWGSEEVQEVDILYKESNSTAVYTVETLKRSDFSTLPSTFDVETELIGAIVQSNQLLRPWDNVPRAAKAQEVIGNRIVYGNYLQNYNVETISLDLTNTPNNHESVADLTKIGVPNQSVKSIRTYQAGIVFADKYGRETPVFSSKSSSTKVDIENSDKANKLSVTPSGTPPDFATHYKFFIKENSNEYYNLALDKFYNAEDGNVWLSFPSSERNKVDIETYLILKKQHDTNVSVKELNRYKILDIESEAPEFISTFDEVISTTAVELLASVDIGFLSIKFKGPSSTKNPQFAPNLAGNRVRFTFGGGTSLQYGVVSATPSNPSNDDFDYDVILDAPLGPDATFMESIGVGTSFNITIIQDEILNKPEFEGRFFVKISRDLSFDTNIIAPFAAMETSYGIIDVFYPDYGWAERNHPETPIGYAYADGGSDFDECTFSGDHRSRLKLSGWDKGIGYYITQTPDPLIQEYFPNYQPPTKGSTDFGIVSMRRGVNSFVDRIFGHVLSQNFVQDTGSGVSPNGLVSTGAEIRFQCQGNGPDSGRYSQIYKINFALGQWSHRGGRVQQWSCSPQGASENQRYAIFIRLNKPITEDWMPSANQWTKLEANLPTLQVVQPIISNSNKLLSSTNPAIFETEPKEKVDLDIYYEASDSLPISNFNTADQSVEWFNCYSYGQGVESNRIRDDYNAVTIDKGVKASTVLDEPYAAERRASGFIFSQIFNSTSGINRLNQFIQAEPITKDLNPIHGSIQKLHARDTDLITLCEDKCFRVLANKDALFNADGNTNLTGNRAVLGQTVPYAGNFGISTNPESFADFGFRLYFSDKNRGAVIRLSRDGITEISTYGMGDFFSDNLRSSTVIKGSYDEDKGLYNLSLNKLTDEWEEKLSTDQAYNLTAECDNPASATEKVSATTLSFKETVNGWTSRKSFLPEEGISLNNIYYTFKNGLLWQHNANPVYNNFYGTQYFSTFNLLVNEAPQAVKGFTALNYSGTASREIEYQYGNKWYSIAEVNANQILPTASQIKREGWYTNFIRTNLEAGEIKEFENKEGKYFNYIKALEVCKTGDGIGTPEVIDPDPLDFLLTVTIDTDCGGSGGTTPDTTQFFFNIWDDGKPADLLDIEPETAAQDVKCKIEDFYDLVNQTYNVVTNQGTAFSYVLEQGLAVGTQMYNSSTNEPISSAGAYLFAGVGQQQNDILLSHAGLDKNNSTVVPATYYVMILGSNGQIASYTKYNTLAACTGVPDRSLRGTGGLSSTLTLGYYNFSIPVQTNAQLWCAVKAYMEAWLLLDPDARGRGWMVPTAYWYGPANFQVGTQLYSYNSSLGFYKKNHDSAGNPGSYGRKEVYRLGTYWSGSLMPIGLPFTSNTTIGNEWFIVTTNNLGIITAIEQYNLINTSC